MTRPLILVLLAVVVVLLVAWGLRAPAEDWQSCFDSPDRARSTWHDKDHALEDARARKLKHSRLAEHKRRELEELELHVEWGVEEHQVGLGAAMFSTKIEAEKNEREAVEVGDTVGCLEEL